jgi:ABC-2 type transport system ATP-binding protein
MMGTRLSVSGLTKSYGGTIAVGRLSFTADPGRTTAILGARGAGKTTIARLLGGFEEPTGGSIRIDDRTVPDRRGRLDLIGVVMADGDELTAMAAGDLSVRGYLMSLCHERGLSGARVREAVARVDLRDVEFESILTLSPERRRRVIAAGALLGDPAILVVDEPASGYTPSELRWLAGLADSMAGRARTLIITTRSLTTARLLADDIVACGGVANGAPARRGEATTRAMTIVRTPDPDVLLAALDPDVVTTMATNGDLYVTGAPASVIGEAAARSGAVLHQLVTCTSTGSSYDAPAYDIIVGPTVDRESEP